MILQTDEQQRKLAIWQYDHREKDVRKLLAKAEEIAVQNASATRRGNTLGWFDPSRRKYTSSPEIAEGANCEGRVVW